ncbi:MAG: hypothetical protein JSV34_03080 [Candidatus Omnitrophota bacterium]|nr:MAG: hypothetical protein JSV34_03080 [Candidatus Omnitrophota bacterium]
MKEKEILHKIISFIGRVELDYLDEIIYDIYFSTGKKIPRSHIIRKIIQMSKKSHNFNKEIIQELKEEKKTSFKKGGKNV